MALISNNNNRLITFSADGSHGASSMKINISWSDDEGQHTSIVELSDVGLVIGRGVSSDIVLKTTSVSRQHARLSKSECGVVIEDLGSKFGTLVDFKTMMPGEKAYLTPGSVVKLGEQSIDIIQLESEAEIDIQLERITSIPLLEDIESLKELALSSVRKPKDAEAIESAFDSVMVKTKSWLERNAVLHHINLLLSRASIVDDLLRQILPVVAGVFNAERGFVLMHNAEKKKFVPAATYRYEIESGESVVNPQAVYSQTVARRCFEQNEVIAVDDIDKNSEFKKAKSIGSYQIKSVLAIPLSYSHEVLAVIYLDSQSLSAKFLQHEDFIKPLQAHLGTAVRHAIHYSQAITDDLTGIFTRRYFEGRIKQAMEHSKRHGSRCSLILLDIDHFKKLNDTYGHNYGDKVLIKVAEVLTESARKSDVVGRLGGEEFVLFLAESNLDGAMNIAERIREKIEALKFKHKESIISITASLGVAEYEISFDTTPYKFLDAADKAMYQAKSEGRNCVRFVLPANPVSYKTMLY